MPAASRATTTTHDGDRHNIDKIVVNGLAELRAASSSTRRNGTFAPAATPDAHGQAATRVKIALLTGTGNDVLDVDGTGFADAILRLRRRRSARQVDIDNDGDIDVSITVAGRASASHGGFGDDRLAAMSVFGEPALLPVTLDGQDGNDTLFGGSADDLMLGGRGNDFINSVGGGADVVAGGDGTRQGVRRLLRHRLDRRARRVKVGTLGGSDEDDQGRRGRHAVAAAGLDAPEGLEGPEVDQGHDVRRRQGGRHDHADPGRQGRGDRQDRRRRTSTIGHHGKTVTAKLGFKAAKSLKGRTLSVDIAATDKAGKTQTENAARSIALR